MTIIRGVEEKLTGCAEEDEAKDLDASCAICFILVVKYLMCVGGKGVVFKTDKVGIVEMCQAFQYGQRWVRMRRQDCWAA